MLITQLALEDLRKLLKMSIDSCHSSRLISAHMATFEAKKFFNLDHSLHLELFENPQNVWEVLPKLLPYLESLLLGKIEITVPHQIFLVNPDQISIGKGTVIEPGVYIQGPTLIGPNNIIRHGSYIRGGVITGSDCIIGHGTEVKHSILFDRVHAAHFNYVGDSILGYDVNLGAGVKLANYRLDHKGISLVIEGKKIFTGLSKMGAILGDEVQLGCNAVTSPGVLMGPKSICYPCAHVRGYIPPRTIYKEVR